MFKQDNQKIWIPLAALIVTSVFNLVIVHFWMAELLADKLEISKAASYASLDVVILLILVVRGINILRGQDWLTNRINQFFTKRN